ncbi:MAG: flagellar biosynthesis protein FlgN, partial [Rhodobacteraceae bacterium]|nr:flagellar biosynthesis protein FlgN [Paracoccaceae bacterium]
LRLKIIRKVKAGMETYDQDGRRSVLSGKPGLQMEKRA